MSPKIQPTEGFYDTAMPSGVVHFLQIEEDCEKV
jgi:hypothetical protein